MLQQLHYKACHQCNSGLCAFVVSHSCRHAAAGSTARTPATGEARYRLCGPPCRLTTRQPGILKDAVLYSVSLILVPAPLLLCALPTQVSSVGGAASGRSDDGLASAVAMSCHTSPEPHQHALRLSTAHILVRALGDLRLPLQLTGRLAK